MRLKRLFFMLITGVGFPGIAQAQTDDVQWYETVWKVVQTLWGLQIFSISDGWVSIGDVVAALIVLMIGIGAAGRFVRFRSRRGFIRMGMSPTPAILVENIIYYLALFLVFLLSLQIANIPLTIFTFLGGAVAIGFGFGAQNILNNFISGLILMIEQPIRIGDMIEVESNYGTVEEIGPRCTKVRLFTGIYILVPNSTLLEKNVINWTLSQDKKVRVQVNVGVEYGSPTRKVKELIERAVQDQEKILKQPEPIILFSAFGDNTLNFEVHFWVKVHTMMDAQRVRSELRFRIDDLFREGEITIAFPQRDVHLDTLKPLDIRLMRPQPDVDKS